MTSLRLTLAVLVLAAACRTTPIPAQPAIPIPPPLDVADAEAAIVYELARQPLPTALAPGEHISQESLAPLAHARGLEPGMRATGWYPESLQPELILAGYLFDRHYLRAVIRFGNDQVQTSIDESQYLKQENGRIHKVALVWMNELDRRIIEAMARMADLRRASDATRQSPKAER